MAYTETENFSVNLAIQKSAAIGAAALLTRSGRDVSRAQSPTSSSLHAPHDSATPSSRRVPADIRLPCMVYAAVGELADAAAAATLAAMEEMRKAPGVVSVLTFETGKSGAAAAPAGVAVIARGFWLARQCLARLIAQCDGSNTDALLAPDVARGTAQVVDGRLRLWLATAQPARTLDEAARCAGLAREKIELRTVGSMDGQAGVEVLVPAIALARQLQPAPVQVIVAQCAAALPAPRQHAPVSQSVLQAMGLAAPVVLAA